MIATLLWVALCCPARAVTAERSIGAARAGGMVVPEVPRLEMPASIPDATGYSGQASGMFPELSHDDPVSIPDATGDSTPLAPLESASVPAGAPALAAPRAVEKIDQALPALEALSEDVKPGAAFTERQFAQKFDGLKDYRAPLSGDYLDLSQIDPSDTGGLTKKKAQKKLAKDQVKLDELQQTLYADAKHKVLIVLQGMDTAGKDGVIRHVMRSLNPQGVQVRSFKKPTNEEKNHHFLWRVINALPGKGMMGIFNRSQYEDILVPSVHPEWYPNMKPEELESRYETINAFEKELAQKGWTIMKFYLHISKDEQKDRLQARIDDPDKNWKFSDSDLAERRFWPRYQTTYGRILARTNTPWAPWYVIPANNKWYRDYLVGRIVKKTLKGLKLKYPPPNPKLKGLKIPD